MNELKIFNDLFFEKKKKILIKNAKIVYGEDFEVVNGYIKIEDGKITEIGEGSARGASAIDAKKGIVMPAFTNAHVHLLDCSGIDEGFYMPIEKRVGRNGIKFKVIERAISNSSIERHVLKCIAEIIKSGTLALCEFREFGIKMKIEKLKRILDWKVLARTFSGEHDFKEKIKKILKEYDGFGISSISDYTREEIEIISKETEKARKILAVHAGEVSDDVKDVLKINPSFIVHATNISEESLKLISEKKIPVVLCARANASFAVGIPNILNLYEKTTVALGTDNAMANNLDMFREIEFVFKVARGISRDWSFGAEEVLKMATINGRKILNLESNAVEEGNKAKIILLRNKYDSRDILTTIVNRYSSCDVKLIVSGDVVISFKSKSL